MSFKLMQGAIDLAVTANKGRAYITEKSIQSVSVKAALRNLAQAAGYTGPIEALTDNDLLRLYALARKDMGGAQAFAALLSKPKADSGFNPLLDSATNPVDPTPPIAPPIAPPSAPGVDIESILEAARKEASAMADYVARDRLDGLLETLRTDIAIKTAEAAQAAIKAVMPVQVTVTKQDAPPVELGLQHERLPLLLAMVGAGCNVYLYGPAGSGKTSAGKAVSKALGLPFYFTGKIDSEYLLLGFVGATGEVVRTQFREAYENGGVFLFDEIDRSAPSAFTALNAALANGICAFPDKTVQMHPEFKCIAAGNTRMSGADNTYTAGQQQDASSIDRFAFMDWQYDERLELAISGNRDWTLYVQRARKAVADRGINHLITPRASIEGAKLLAAGVSVADTCKAWLWKGLDEYTVASLVDAIGEYA